ncbi:hypothetical protein WN51_05517 [Melipona quadrifasciata]|uniref:Uncharacterized protein n=1 Tax=Melipona quadrifasciata TaxID=166423 RepID=A0A0M8ZV91_9HYME|nr:hypothetical protein WN51_05517 [Melipona quadrifasciata]
MSDSSKTSKYTGKNMNPINQLAHSHMSSNCTKKPVCVEQHDTRYGITSETPLTCANFLAKKTANKERIQYVQNSLPNMHLPAQSFSHLIPKKIPSLPLLRQITKQSKEYHTQERYHLNHSHNRSKLSSLSTQNYQIIRSEQLY